MTSWGVSASSWSGSRPRRGEPRRRTRPDARPVDRGSRRPGAAAAAMIPQVLATFRAIFAGKDGVGCSGCTGRSCLRFRTSLGGLLTSADLFGWSWRTVFLINVPIALVSLVAGARVVPETRDRSAGRPDVVGAALLTGAPRRHCLPAAGGRGALAGPPGSGLSSRPAWPSSRRCGSSRSAASTRELRRSCGRGCSASRPSAPG